jgi:SAM-dependent methyltransferase
MNDATSTTARPRRRDAYRPGASQEEFIVPLLGERIRAALQLAPISSSAASALDVGCGEQPLRAVIEALGYRYVSLDVHQNSQGNVTYLGTLDGALPPEVLLVGGFDLLVCTEVLEHVADWPTAFRNLARLMKPGGRLLITCPHFYPLHEEPYDYWRPTPYAMGAFAQREGLVIVHQERAGDGWDVLGTMVACLRPAGGIGLLGRLLSFAADISRKALFVIMRTRVFQRRVRLQGSLYLANVLLLEKPR